MLPSEHLFSLDPESKTGQLHFQVSLMNIGNNLSNYFGVMRPLTIIMFIRRPSKSEPEIRRIYGLGFGFEVVIGIIRYLLLLYDQKTRPQNGGYPPDIRCLHRIDTIFKPFFLYVFF